MTPQSPRIFRTQRLGAVLLAAMLLVGLLPGSVLAAIAVTPATGGSAVSADTNSVDGTGAWTTLTGPQVNGTAGDLDAGTVIFTIDDAAEFAFNAGVGSTSLTGAGCGTLVASSPTVLAATVTITLTGDSSGTCNLVLAGLQARPTAAGAAPLETSGITASGTAGATGSAGTLTVVPGAAILQFTQGTIGNAASGADLSPQPVVHSEDMYSNARVGDAITISIKPGTGTAGATVDCTTNPVATDGSGNATFAGCDIDVAGTGYRLLASTPGGTSGESNLFNITAGAATKLFFFAQPSRGTPGGAFATQPVVEIQDALGNRVTSDSTTDVTLALTTGTGSLSCTGGLTKEAVSGLATFTGCSITTVGVNKVITATSAPALTAAVSNVFDVADRLVFTTQPSSSTSAGVAFASQPVVAVRAGASDTAIHDQATVVTLSIKAGTGATGAVLSCTGGLSKTVVNGVATFAGCSIDKISPTSPANPYKIVATATNLTALTSAESNNVTITAGPATKLGFTAQPTGGVASQAFPIQPVVAIQDAGGNTVTSGTNSTATITLSLAPGGPAGAVLTCTGGLSKVAVAGVATFAGCAINAAGTYRLVATATTVAAGTSLTPVTGNSFVVTAPGAAITLTTSAPTPPGAQNPVILWGQGITLTVQFGMPNGGNKTFQLQGTRDNITWTTITTLTTNASGRATLFYTPVTNLWYRAVFAGTPDLAAANSNVVRTVVRQLALLRPTNHGEIRTISRNTSIQFTTTVRPARPELAPARVTFTFFRFSAGAWRFVTSRDVVIDSAGLARTTFRFTSVGQWYVRSQANPTPYNANSVNSPPERYSVR
jgi:hypothetical protein